MILDKKYWKDRYKSKQTGWDVGYASPALIEYCNQLHNRNTKILIPGCGNAYEAEYLFKKGFKNIYILDVVEGVLRNFKKRVPEFPSENLICEDFFKYNDAFDLILEQTFFCALPIELRNDYILKSYNLLYPKGKIAGVLFSSEFSQNGPPFGGSKKEYELMFSKHYRIKTLENCYNSIDPRMDNELFFIFEKPL